MFIEAPLCISLLGNIEIIQGEQPINKFQHRKTLALLAYLAVTGQPHSREVLAGLLWGETSETNALAGLRKVLLELRRNFGAAIFEQERWVSLNTAVPLTLDVEKFNSTLRIIREKSVETLTEEEARQLEQALDLYRGDFLEGLYLKRAPAFEDWLTLERERFRLDAIFGNYLLSAYHYRQANYSTALKRTQRLLELDPTQEEAHRQLMSLFALSGQRTLALQQYKICRQTLKKTFNLQPQEETRELYQRIKTDGEPLEQHGVKNKLPVPTTPLVGREADLKTLSAQLKLPACRLLTICGPGGVGKTHLALTLAANLKKEQGAFGDEILFIPLTALRTLDSLPSTIAFHLNIQFHKDLDPIQQLCAALENRDILLILDNFEHLITDFASPHLQKGLLEGENIISTLIQSAPGLKILVTSRISLGLQGEYLHLISGIDYPKSGALPAAEIKSYPAVKLFLRHTNRISPEFIPDDTQLTAIAKICQQVQGLPLGILLATGWSNTFSPTEIARQLLSDSGKPETGFDFLSTNTADLPARHRSLNDVFSASWNLLNEQTRKVLAALSVFRDSFSFDAAQHITGAKLRDLHTLVNQSLVQKAPHGRYQIHPLLRQFARQRLEDLPLIRKKFLAYYAKKLSHWAQEIKTERQLLAVKTMDLEIGNARSAWDWAISIENWDFINQSMDGLCHYYDWQHRFPEGQSACQLLTTQLGPKSFSSKKYRILYAKALVWCGIFAPLQQTEAYFYHSLEILEDASIEKNEALAEKAFASNQLARIISQTGSDFNQVVALYERSLEMAQILGDPWEEATALQGLGTVLWDQSQYPKAQFFMEKAVELYRKLGDKRGLSHSLLWLGNILLFQGSIKGEEIIEESLTLIHSFGNQTNLVEAFNQASSGLMVLGRFSKATELMTKKLELNSVEDFRQDVIRSMLACTLIHMGKYDEAYQHAEIGLSIARRIKDDFGLGFALIVRGWSAFANNEFAAAQAYFQEAIPHCETQHIKELLSWAYAFSALTRQKSGEHSAAKENLIAGLKTALEIDSFVGKLFGVNSSLTILFDTGKADLSRLIYFSLQLIPMVKNSVFMKITIPFPQEPVQLGQLSENQPILSLDQMVELVLTEIP